jgi:hypothetical protein
MSDEQKRDVDDYIVRAWSEINQAKLFNQDRSDDLETENHWSDEDHTNTLSAIIVELRG